MSDEFKPSKKQIRFLENMHAYGLEFSTPKLCKLARVEPTEVAQWKEYPSFNLWFKSAIQALREDQRRSVLDHLYEDAMCGDAPAARLFLAATGGIEVADLPDVRDIAMNVELIESKIEASAKEQGEVEPKAADEEDELIEGG